MGIALYGAVRQLHAMQTYTPENLTHIYGTSVGAILGTIVALKYDWDTVNDYIIKRPWEKLFHVDIETMINAVSRCGILDTEVINQVLAPLLGGKNISTAVSLQEFKEITGVSMTVVATDSDLRPAYFSPDTHPHIRLTDAIRASCCIPVVFQPARINNAIYIDGAFSDNFPITKCKEECEDETEYLAIGLDDRIKGSFNTNSIIEFVMSVFNMLLMQIFCRPLRDIDERTLLIKHGGLSASEAIDIIANEQSRIDLINYGVNVARDYTENRTDIEKDDNNL
jgi:predicted acylesterase/phospholipase RssA